MIRTGTTFKRNNFSTTLQFSYIAKHYSDATNSEWTSTGIEGEIPAYSVVDLTASYSWKMLSLDVSCNNIFDESYFTRRADSYPGPGIIPADGRGVYVTLQARIGK
jgi:Fe(3+) dicitrate transport protein